MILLDIRAAWREYLQAIATELVGEMLCLPGKFIVQKSMENLNDDANFVKELCRYFDKLCLIDGICYGKQSHFVVKDLKKHVFLGHDGSKRVLQLPCDGLFMVVTRNDKNFVLCIHDKNTMVSIDRIKSAYLFSDSLTNAGEQQQPMATKSNKINEE